MKRETVCKTAGEYRHMLLERRSKVLAGLGLKCETLAAMGRVAEDDQAAISHDEFVSIRLSGLEHLELRMVEEALDRLETGDYGICMNCEEAIPPKRLRALSWARYCVSCQENIDAERSLN